MNNYKKAKIISFYVNIISLKELLNQIRKFLLLKKSHYICVSNVHQCIESYKNKKFAEVINNADLAIPDGRPIYWALKLLKNKEAEQIPSYFATKQICEFASVNNLRIGFYGGETESLKKCVSNLKNEYKKLRIDYAYSPPFRALTSEEKMEVAKNINTSEIEILFVCLGCPKQEYWMAENKDYLNCTSIGIGEVLNIISGKTKLPPRWIQKIGMGWFFRLLCEPRRLFWRYFSTNFKFIYLFSRQFFFHIDP